MVGRGYDMGAGAGSVVGVSLNAGFEDTTLAQTVGFDNDMVWNVLRPVGRLLGFLYYGT